MGGGALRLTRNSNEFRQCLKVHRVRDVTSLSHFCRVGLRHIHCSGESGNGDLGKPRQDHFAIG